MASLQSSLFTLYVSLLMLCAILSDVASAASTTITVTNPSFGGADGWEGLADNPACVNNPTWKDDSGKTCLDIDATWCKTKEDGKAYEDDIFPGMGSLTAKQACCACKDQGQTPTPDAFSSNNMQVDRDGETGCWHPLDRE